MRRHGSIRGGAGGAVRTASNSCSAHSSLPAAAQRARPAPRAAGSAARRRARRRRASRAAADGCSSRRPSGPSPGRRRGAARPSCRARPVPRRAAGRPVRCRTAGPGAGRPRPGTAGPGWRRAGSTPRRPSASSSAAEVGQRDRVDERRADAVAAQLHQVGALAVAVARGAFGVDGDRPGAVPHPARSSSASCGRRGDRLGHAVGRLAQQRHAGRLGRRRRPGGRRRVAAGSPGRSRARSQQGDPLGRQPGGGADHVDEGVQVRRQVRRRRPSRTRAARARRWCAARRGRRSGSRWSG